MHFRTLFPWLACAGAFARPARAQAPATGPLLLRLPASTRAAALGNAWVVGRDEDVVFYNPAQLIGSVRGGLNATYAHYGTHTSVGSIAWAYAAGPASLTIGAGLQFADYATRPEIPYPYVTSMLTNDGTVDAFSMLMTSGLAIVVKGFRVGVAGKYASDRVAEASLALGGPINTRHDAFLGDAGLARSLFGGVVGASVQNLGSGTTDGSRRIKPPRQASLGWATTKQAGQFDVGLFGQVTGQTDWISPGGGVELAYGWIEGYSLALRIGARRTDSMEEHPVAFGASFTGDHLTLDYALQQFDGGRYANRITFRWR
jgi:hypothetical protein